MPAQTIASMIAHASVSYANKIQVAHTAAVIIESRAEDSILTYKFYDGSELMITIVIDVKKS